MIELLFWLNVLFTGGVILHGFCHPTGYMQVPFLIALTYAGWYLPQAAVLLDDTTLPTGGSQPFFLCHFFASQPHVLAGGWRLGEDLSGD